MKRFRSLLGVSLLVVFVSCGSPSVRHEHATMPSGTQPVTDGHPSSLTVALYPYVPRLSQFEQVIAAAWQEFHTGVTLKWATGWDGGYSTEPDPSYDVFVFDALNLGYFQSKGYLLPIATSQVANYSDIVAFARDGVTVGNTLLGIPQLGCGDFLFYRSSDSTLAAVTNETQLAQALGVCKYYGEKPPNATTGLMVDLAGGTTVSSTYLESLYELYGKFPASLPKTIDPAVASTLQGVVSLSSFTDVLYENDAAPYQRASWFGQGTGRAYVGFTESMSQLNPQVLATIRFKPMPWSTKSDAINKPLFYSDVVGVSPSTSKRGTTALAIRLANLMTSASVITKVFGPSGSSGPQYLMPVSTSALKQLAAQYPAYAQMSNVLSGLQPALFNLGPTSKTWLHEMKRAMKSVLLASPICYCDATSPPIANDADAKAKCSSTCGARGWGGQWTSDSGSSVCGCDGACGATRPR